MKKWARVGMTIEVDDRLWASNPQEAVMRAFFRGKVELDGETYFPNEASENTGDEPDMHLSGGVRLK
jgi:hypothetical protein